MVALAAVFGLSAAGAANAPPDGAAAASVVAGDGANYAVDTWTVDCGGGTSSGGTFEIRGTIGQPDADPLQPSTGGVYELTGGFWPGLAPATPQPDALFANGFE